MMTDLRVLVLGSLFFAACAGSNAPATLPTDDGDGAGGDGSGDSDTPVACDDGYIRDGFGSCRKVCATTADCGDLALECEPNVGLCMPAADVHCDPDSCAPGTVCPPDGSVDCVPVDSQPGLCASDADCDLASRCDNGTCVSRVGDVVKTCTTDTDCNILAGIPSGMTCQLGVCLGCLEDIQCGATGKCVMGTCIIADLGTAGNCIGLTCNTGERCNPTTGACEVTCDPAVSPSACPDGKKCAPILNQCVDNYGCATDADCRADLLQVCLVGLCVGCTADGDCKTSEKCVGGGIAGVCFPSFQAADPCAQVTCAANQSCDPQNGSCYPSNGTCASAADCRPGYTCNFFGLCSGCSVDADCRPAQRCLLSTCIPMQ